MRLLIAAIGKLKQGPERDLFAHYLGRAEAAGRKLHLAPLNAIEVAESKGATASARKDAEAQALLARIPAAHLLICLDPGGEALSSEAFAQTLAKFRDGGTEGLAFMIGGADGLGKDALAKAAKLCFARSDDLAARSRANRSCRADLPRGDHPFGPSLSSRLTTPQG